MEEAEHYNSSTAGEEIIPVEQETILFYEKSLMVVRLPDGRPGVVVRSLCDNMQLDRVGQIRRIQRTEAIADDLVSNVRLETDGGPQHVHVLVLRSVAYWLATIDAKRVREEIRPDIVRYQKEAVDALYMWAQSPRVVASSSQQRMIAAQTITTSSVVFPAELAGPMQEPGLDASHTDRATYHEIMSVWHRSQADYHLQQWRGEVDEWRGSMESRLEAKEAITGLIPEILDRLGPELLTSEHQRQVQVYARELHVLTNMPYPTIYDRLKTVVGRPRIESILEAEWSKVERWFLDLIERARNKDRQ